MRAVCSRLKMDAGIPGGPPRFRRRISWVRPAPVDGRGLDGSGRGRCGRVLEGEIPEGGRRLFAALRRSARRRSSCMRAILAIPPATLSVARLLTRSRWTFSASFSAVFASSLACSSTARACSRPFTPSVSRSFRPDASSIFPSRAATLSENVSRLFRVASLTRSHVMAL